MRHPVVTAILIVAVGIAAVMFGPRLFKTPLTRAEERWFESPRTEYTMTIEARCFCGVPPRFTVIVRGGEPARAVTEGRRIPMREARDYGIPLTVTDLFMMVHELSARYGNVQATFDPRWGYPVSIESNGEADTIDDEISLNVTAFREVR